MRKQLIIHSKRGDIWISAVLYIALGVVAITIILAAGVPLINKLKDKGTITQSKEFLNVLDKAISDVRKEGTGSKRFLSSAIIKGGEIVIDSKNDRIKWSMKITNVLVEPCDGYKSEETSLEDCIAKGVVIREGNLYVYQTSTIVKDEYMARVELDYPNVDILTNNQNPLSGKYSFSIENTGLGSEDGKPVPRIMITVT